ncbi:hypothetical protein ACFYOK_18505 [Microbispora bryophytorum]|uniref:hypothetical protein n=1 Tax=Microbispora bryophytorum TaxID=1460882 RepID=UPI0033EEC7B5
MTVRKVTLKVAALLATALSAGAVVTTITSAPAQAGGTSRTTYGCYARWWDTAFAGYCSPSTRNQSVQLHANCSLEPDYQGPWIGASKGEYLEPFDSDDCTFPVDGASIGYN